jgi:hypothetical protein
MLWYIRYPLVIDFSEGQQVNGQKRLLRSMDDLLGVIEWTYTPKLLVTSTGYK